MVDIIRKVIEDCEVKKLAERTYEFTASTMAQDRDGEVIDAEGWELKNFKKNPVIMYAHDYQALPIGKASRVWVSDGKLKNTVEFPPAGTYEFADIVERLVNTGYLKTESVGFIPKKWDDGDGEKAPKRRYTKQELLEISIVPIPSNPEALREAVEKGVITENQFEVITKPEETENYFRIPVDTGDHGGHRIRTIDISAKEGITALYCGECKKVITYLFSKEEKFGWTMEKAKAWVKEHEKDYPPRPASISQAELKDELDFILSILRTVGISDEVKPIALSVKDEIVRLTGNDIPDKDIKPEIKPESSGISREDATEIIKQTVQKMMEEKRKWN